MFRSIIFLATLAILALSFTAVDASPELMNKLVKEYRDNTKERLPQNGSCTADKLAVRKEWYAFPLTLFHFLLYDQTANMLLHATGVI